MVPKGRKEGRTIKKETKQKETSNPGSGKSGLTDLGLGRSNIYLLGCYPKLLGADGRKYGMG